MRRFLIVTVVLVSFCLFFTIALLAESDFEYSRNRVLIINDIENLEIIKKNEINIEGDYLVGFNGIDNIFNLIYLNDNLTVFDEETFEYASYKYYLEEDYEKFLDLVGKLFDEPIVDYIDARDLENQKTNISQTQEEKYRASLEVVKNIHETIQGRGNYYSVDYNDEWLKVFQSFEVETDGIVNENIVNENIEKISKEKLYKQKFLSTFFKVYVPYLECSADYCKYNDSNINEIEENFNADLKMKINYQFLDLKNYTGIEEQLSEEDIALIEQENKDQEKSSNTYDEINQEVDSDGDGMVDSSDPYPQDPYNNQSVDSSSEDESSSGSTDETDTSNNQTNTGVEDDTTEIDGNISGGDVIDPDTGGDVIDPDTGGDVTDPDTGQDVTDPDTGGDVTDPDGGDEVVPLGEINEE